MLGAARHIGNCVNCVFTYTMIGNSPPTRYQCRHAHDIHGYKRVVLEYEQTVKRQAATNG